MIKLLASLALLGFAGVGHAQGKFEILVNSKPAHAIEGKYEVKIGDHIDLRITETGTEKYDLVQFAALQARTEEAQTAFAQSQGEQGEQSADQEPAPFPLPVRFFKGVTYISYAIPSSSLHQADFKILLHFFDTHAKAAKKFSGYTDKINFYLK